MTAVLRSIRLIPTDATTLNNRTGEPGEIFFDRTNSTLRIYNGTISGGIATIANEQWVNTNFSNLVNGAPSNLSTLSQIASSINNDPNYHTTVSTAFTNLVNGAPSNLSTLSQIASAINNDPNYYTTVKSYIDTSITNLIASAPGALNTLNELATALGDDPNFATTMASSLALKAPLASPALTGTASITNPNTTDVLHLATSNNSNGTAITLGNIYYIGNYRISTDNNRNDTLHFGFNNGTNYTDQLYLNPYGIYVSGTIYDNANTSYYVKPSALSLLNTLNLTTSSTNNGLLITDGTVTSIYYNESSSYSAIGTASNHPVTIWTNNIERIRVDVNGNVGIGVTPATATRTTLQIGAYGTIDNNGGTGIEINSNAVYNSGWKYIASAAATQYYQFNGSHVWQNAPSGTAGNSIASWTPSMTLNASGNLSITGSMTATNSLSITATSGTQYLLIGNQDSGGVNKPRMLVGANANLLIGIGNSWSSSTGGTFTEQLRVNASGGVSIGTTADPGANNLKVAGTVNASQFIGGTNAGPATASNYALQASGSYGGGLCFTDTNCLSLYSTGSGTYLNFGFGASGSIASKGYVDSSGNLSINGSSYVAGTMYDNANTSYYVKPSSTSVLSVLTVGGFTVSQNSTKNLQIATNNASDMGILMKNSAGTFGFNLYGDSNSNYGFLASSWGNWDLEKNIGGNLYFNNNTTYYLNPPGTSYSNLTTANNSTLVAGEGNAFAFWNDTTNYKIAMGVTAATYQYGPVTDYSMRFTMGAGTGRGFTWGYAGSAPIAALNAYSGNMQIAGTFSALSKSFLIDHPTKPNMKLRYGSLEGPENGVYVRGRLTNDSVIQLPDYWTGLVDENTITVNLTAIGAAQNLYVVDISNNTVTIGGSDSINCFYTVFAERKDVEKLVVEFDA